MSDINSQDNIYISGIGLELQLVIEAPAGQYH